MGANGDNENASGAQRGAMPEKPAILEWIMAAVGLILLVGTLAYLLYQAAAGDDTPPRITVEVESAARQGDQFLVTFSAANEGGTTAADVTVEAQLLAGDEVIESSTATIDYVPAGSSRRGGLFFTQDPDAYTLEIRALGYEQP